MFGISHVANYTEEAIKDERRIHFSDFKEWLL